MLLACHYYKRKQLLQNITPKNSLIRYSDHIEAKGKDFFKVAQAKSLEGFMAKQVQSTYQVDRRSRDWLKIKTHMRQEVVIGGLY
jgi:bifunctional non-homologous end joining protein LigD